MHFGASYAGNCSSRECLGPRTYPATTTARRRGFMDSTARVSYVGHATVLLQVAGMNILTDPVWAERALPVSFAGPKRVREPRGI